MSEKNPSAPVYTANEISNLIGDVVKVGKSGTTFHRPDGKLLSREEIRQIIANADLIRGNEFSDDDEETVFEEAGYQLPQTDDVQPTYMDTWPADHDVETHARLGHLEDVISELKRGSTTHENADYVDAVSRNSAGGIVPYTWRWPEVSREESEDSGIISLNFDSEKRERLHSGLSKIRRGLGVAAAKLTSVVGKAKSQPTHGSETSASEADSVAIEASREKLQGRQNLKRRLGLTAVAAMVALLPVSNSHDRISNTDIPVATPLIESIAPDVPIDESTPALFSVIEETTPVVGPTPTLDIGVTFWIPDSPTENVKVESTSSDMTEGQLETPMSVVAMNSSESKLTTELETGDTKGFDQTTVQKLDDDAIVDLTGDPVDTSEAIGSNKDEESERTFEQSAPVLTIENEDGFTNLLQKYRPDLDDTESYTLFKRLLEVFGADNIFLDVETYEMKNGDPGIKNTGTTQFAPGVQDFVDRWMPGR